MTSWVGKTVLVVGAARQGLAASRYLATHGSNVILTDSRPEEFFIEHTREFEKLPIRFVFGNHPLTLLEKVDGICVSGGVPLDIPLILQAVKKGLPLTNDAQLFMDIVKAKVIGITGSAGKTTTTILIGEIAKVSVNSDQNVWVGGNIGNPLINQIDDIKANDWVVMELSSFQLELMQTSPSISVILNITPNHLDRHRTMQAYIEAKAKIIHYQDKLDTAILNRDDPGSYNLRDRVNGELISFGFEKPDKETKGTYIKDHQLIYFDGNKNTPLMPLESVQLPGKHNLMNALAASTACIAAGFGVTGLEKGIRSVNGVPHRLELIREKDGVRWYNDSIATAPERVMAALDAIPGNIVLLLGGRDKKLPWTDLVEILHQRKPKVILFGEAGPMIKDVIYRFEGTKPEYPVIEVKNLKNAVTEASLIATKNESVLLSPGGTSFDAFLDFEERGDLFRELVKAIR